MTSRMPTDRWTRLDQLVAPYPPELFQLLQGTFALPDVATVVDLGAGSGRGTLPMARRGWRVIAVDPDTDALVALRARAAATGCDVVTVSGTAEATTLDDSVADLVTAAHAFHWFEAGPALAEIERITRPRGGVALFWNVRDVDGSDFLGEYNELLRANDVDAALYLEAQRAAEAAGVALRQASAFGQLEHHDVPHDWQVSANDFVELALMPRWIHDWSASQRDEFLAQLDRLLGRHAEPSTGTITIPHRTSVWTARRSTT